MRTIVGVMGPAESATAADVAAAAELGRLIAENGWVLLTGGRNCGVMAAASREAHEVSGALTLGILPHPSSEVAPDVDLAIFTDLGEGRNHVNVLTSRLVFACGMSAGTLSEIALAIKAGKDVILLNAGQAAESFLAQLGGPRIHRAATPEEAVAMARRILRG
jgi:uncharacterized protein (TIGR00725 family)